MALLVLAVCGTPAAAESPPAAPPQQAPAAPAEAPDAAKAPAPPAAPPGTPAAPPAPSAPPATPPAQPTPPPVPGTPPAPDAPASASTPGAPTGPAAPASAPSPPTAPIDDTQVARALFAEGLAHSDAERWSEAADCFRRVLAIRWSAAAAHNLGAALVELGRLVEAGEQLRLVARDSEADQEMRAASQRVLDAIEPQVGKLSVRIVGAREGIEVVLDGHLLPTAALDGPIRIDPGRHVVVARRRGTYVAREDIFLGTGGPRAIEVALDVSPRPPEFAPLPDVLPASAGASAGGAATPLGPSPHKGTAGTTDDGSPWWLWLGGGLAVTGIVAVALVLGFGNETSAAHPVEGDLGPGIVRGQVIP